MSDGQTEMAREMREAQVGGDHYKRLKIQPWDVMDSLPTPQQEGYYKGNVIKYLMRMGNKGPAKEDAEKALHYLRKLISVL